MTPEEYKRLARKPNKFGAKKAQAFGTLFDSKKEHERYKELKILEAARQITNVTIHPSFLIQVAGVHICTYIADFSYHENGEIIVEDVKSKPTMTQAARLKHKLFRALYPQLELRIVL